MQISLTEHVAEMALYRAESKYTTNYLDTLPIGATVTDARGWTWRKSYADTWISDHFGIGSAGDVVGGGAQR